MDIRYALTADGVRIAWEERRNGLGAMSLSYRGCNIVENSFASFYPELVSQADLICLTT